MLQNGGSRPKNALSVEDVERQMMMMSRHDGAHHARAVHLRDHQSLQPTTTNGARNYQLLPPHYTACPPPAHAMSLRGPLGDDTGPEVQRQKGDPLQARFIGIFSQYATLRDRISASSGSQSVLRAAGYPG